MQQWEYCAVAGVARESRWFKSDYPALWQFTADGVKTTYIEVKTKGEEPNEVAKVIARLGLEGWEMVATPPTAISVHVIYFKRPLPTP